MRPRVLSYPPVHDYVDRLRDVADFVERDQPWPRLPDLYDPGWIRRHNHRWDIAHLHFTWEQYPVPSFRRALEAHRACGTPVIWTAHDLRNPHTPDADRDRPYLDVLAELADEVVTLTPGAAQELRDRYGREARVIPHGPLVPTAEAVRLRDGSGATRPPLRLLLLAKSLRANLDWSTPIEVAMTLAAEDVPIQLDVHLHPDADRRGDVVRLGAGGGVTVRVATRLTRDDLWRQIANADVLLLPYLWGTHSGLLELAADLGTPVVAGDVGYLAEQAPCRVVPVTVEGLEPGALRTALRELVRGGLPPVVPVAQREAGFRELRQAHSELYAGVCQAGGTAVAR